MRLPLLPEPLPEIAVSVQGPRSGRSCRVAVYRLVDFNDGLSFRAAEKWGRALVKMEERCNDSSGGCPLPSY